MYQDGTEYTTLTLNLTATLRDRELYLHFMYKKNQALSSWNNLHKSEQASNLRFLTAKPAHLCEKVLKHEEKHKQPHPLHECPSNKPQEEEGHGPELRLGCPVTQSKRHTRQCHSHAGRPGPWEAFPNSLSRGTW